MQKSYCYTPGVSVRVGVRVHVQNVRANVKVLKFQSFCIFSCILSLLIILIKPLTTKAYDRRASGDCGTSGVLICPVKLARHSFYYQGCHDSFCCFLSVQFSLQISGLKIIFNEKLAGPLKISVVLVIMEEIPRILLV